MAFPQSFLDELVERADIADVVGDYVQLQRKGQNLFGLCPFHSEKSPSFSVSSEKQIFHCFGCGVGGGVLTFVKMAENLEFADAVRFLANRQGMTVPEDGDAAGSRRRGRLYELMKAAAKFYHENLLANEAGMSYLRKRGFSERSIKRFGLGYAPDDWSALLDGVKGFDRIDFYDAGLVIKNKSGGLYDRFRGRIMFPIIDVKGTVVAFGGRVLDNSEPKYLNSPETTIFSKSRHLFALNLAKKSKAGRLILAEGYMDVIALHQSGFDCAVASLGTSLTDAQARLISRYAREAVIAYDMDAAGRGAAERAINMLEAAGVGVKLLNLDGAKDPDEFIQRYGSDTLKNRLEQSENHIEYRLQNVKMKHNIESDEGRVAYIKEASAILATLEKGAARAVYTSRVAEIGGVDIKVVEHETEEVAEAARKKRTRKERRRVLQPAEGVQPSRRGSRYDNIKSAVAEEMIIAIVFNDPELLKLAKRHIAPEAFTSPVLGRIYRAVCEAENVSITALEQLLEPNDVEHTGRILMKPLPGPCGGEELQRYIQTVRDEGDKNESDLFTYWQKQKQKKVMEDKK